MRLKPENARSQLIIPSNQQLQQSEGKLSRPHLKGSDWGHNHFKKVLEQQTSQNAHESSDAIYNDGERPQEDHYQIAGAQQSKPQWQVGMNGSLQKQ